MADILYMPQKDRGPARTVEGAWAEFQRLSVEAIDDPSLMIDLAHATARVRAWRAWCDLFLAKDAG